MSSTLKITTLSFCLLFLISSTKASSEPLFHFCSNPENFTAGSPFADDLSRVLTRLSTQVPPSGFGSGYAGQVTGLGLCRGDVTAQECKACVAEAASELHERCPYNKAAVVWYDSCLLKYSDEPFLGQIDRKNRFYMWNVNDVTGIEGFDAKVAELLGKLNEEAAGDKRLYAVGQDGTGVGSGTDGTLYGLSQCTRDLSGPDCNKCLDDAVAELPKFSAGKRGGRVVGGSCYVRYELYPIVTA